MPVSKGRAFLVSLVISIVVGSTLAAVYLYRPLEQNQPFTSNSSPTVDHVSNEEQSEKIQTPLQQDLQQSIDKLIAEGKPHPIVTFESNVSTPSPAEKQGMARSQGSFETKVIARTIVKYDGPQQAGKTRWDDIIIKNENQTATSGSNTTLLEGNLTQMLIDKYPQIYGEGGYRYGEEPRTFIIDENITATFLVTKQTSKLSEQSTSAISTTATPLASNPDSYSSNIVMGFSYLKKIDYSLNPKLQVFGFTLSEAKVGFVLDVGLGLRLPARVEVTAPSPIVSVASEGQNYIMTTSITPLNFDAQDYERLGLPAEDGHEFFARGYYFLGVRAWILDRIVVDRAREKTVDIGQLCTIQIGVDCQDFVTPFGRDENGDRRSLPLPTITLSPDDTGLQLSADSISVRLGLKIVPEIASDNITADWTVSGHSSSSGQVTYTQSYPALVSFGQLPAGDISVGYGIGEPTTVTVDNFKLHLNKQLIALLGNVQLDFLGYNLYQSRYFHLAEFDFSSLFHESVIGQHAGTQGLSFTLTPAAVQGDTNATLVTKPAVAKIAKSNATLTVSTDKSAYGTGETTMISGHTSNKDQQIFVQVFNPKGAAYRFDLIPVSNLGIDGTYSYMLKVGGKLGIDGVYKIVVTQPEQRAETTFTFNSGH